MKELKLDDKQFQNVLKKAVAVRPLVRIGSAPGSYLVRGSTGNFYPVRFQISGGGRPLGSCLCEGFLAGFYCYHLAAALIAHSSFVRAGFRASAPAREFSI